MISKPWHTAVILVALLALPYQASAADLCLKNSTPQPLLMLLDDPKKEAGNWLMRKRLASGQTFCCSDVDGCRTAIQTTPSPFTVYAFENDDDLEGCSVAARPGDDVEIKAFVAYDRCHWKFGPNSKN